MAKLGQDASGLIFDHIIAAKELKNDAALATLLGIQASTISKIRGGTLDPSSAVLVACHERGGLSFPDMRAMMPIPKA